MVKNKIKQRREMAKFSQQTFSDLLPSKPGKVLLSMIENGHALPTPELMDEICKVFCCLPTHLYDEKDLIFTGVNDAKAEKENEKNVFKLKLSQETIDALIDIGYASPDEWFRDMQRQVQEKVDIRVTRRIAAENLKLLQSIAIVDSPPSEE